MDSLVTVRRSLGRVRRGVARLKDRVLNRVIPGREARTGAEFWAAYRDYEEYYNDELASQRSRWLAQELGQGLGIESLLEVGTNSGRNLAFFKEARPGIKLRGFDVNARAIEFAQAKNPDIEFLVANANAWPEEPKSWDAVLTMSVLDHIPDRETEILADSMVRTVRRFIITVELWDGSHGTRGPWKYSRDNKALFEKREVRTMRWEVFPVGQYDTTNSLLWLYVGEVARPVE